MPTTRPRDPRLAVKLAALLLSSAFALGIGEVMVRALGPDRHTLRAGMLSSPHFALDERGAVRLRPDERVRLVQFFDETLEYDISFRTNQSGFVDHRDYVAGPPDRRSYAFVGDSLVHGMGAEPWVPRLRDDLRAAGRDIEIYNLGVPGASIQHFRALLRSVAEDLPISGIVLLPISNDFYRPWWVPVESGDRVRLCRDPAACQGDAFFHVIDAAATVPELVARIRAAAAVSAPLEPIGPFWKQALWSSELYLLARRNARDVLRRAGVLAPPQQVGGLLARELLDVNLDALEGIRADFPDTPIALVQLPEKDEVRRGAYDLDLAGAAAAFGIDYIPLLTRCQWTPDMYHRVDSHPNAAGYANIARCLHGSLFQEP